jgi:Type II secretory pathway, component PulF
LETFSYSAVDKKGNQKKGAIESDNIDKAIATLKADGLIPISVAEQSLLGKDIELKFLSSKPKARDLSVFCRQFVSIISAGVPIITALEMLSEQTENKMLKGAISETKRSIEKGESLAASMKKHPDVFSEIFITMVEAGEVSGSLEISFVRMAQQFEKEARLKALMKKATIYPAVVSVVALGVVIVMLTFVVPTFQSMFDDLGTKLPALTLAVVAASKLMQSYWYIFIAVIVGGIFGIKQFGKTMMGKRIFGKIELKLPLFGKLVTKSASSRLARTLSTLLAAGIPLMESLDITASTMMNIYFKELLLEAKDEVAMGTPLSAPITNGGLFPPLVCHMIKIGEDVGDMEAMLDKLADYYDEEVEMATQALMAALEPMIIIVLAVVIGTIIMSVMLPMADMYKSLETI